MLLIAALTLVQPAPPLDVEVLDLAIAGGRTGSPTVTVGFEVRTNLADPQAATLGFSRNIARNRGAEPRAQITDSADCPGGALIARAAPVASGAVLAPMDGPIVVVADGSSYLLRGRVRSAGSAWQPFELFGRSRSGLGWWAEQLLAALEPCWVDAPTPPAPPPAVR